MGVGKIIINRIVKEVIEKIVDNKNQETKITFSSTKKHTLW